MNTNQFDDEVVRRIESVNNLIFTFFRIVNIWSLLILYLILLTGAFCSIALLALLFPEVFTYNFNSVMILIKVMYNVLYLLLCVLLGMLIGKLLIRFIIIPIERRRFEREQERINIFIQSIENQIKLKNKKHGRRKHSNK
jgi:hypothetical protein